eukprot:3132824-Amphidinium_carterae.1
MDSHIRERCQKRGTFRGILVNRSPLQPNASHFSVFAGHPSEQTCTNTLIRKVQLEGHVPWKLSTLDSYSVWDCHWLIHTIKKLPDHNGIS